MKSCISLYSYSKAIKSGGMTFFQAIDKTRELGLDAVEIWMDESVLPEGKTLGGFVAELAAYAKSVGLEVPILTLGANIYRFPEKDMPRLRSMIDVASECGIPMMRFDVTYAFLGTETSKTPKKVIEAVAPRIRELAEYAKTRGVKTCSENHGRLLLDSDRMEELFYQVDHENYGLLCDMGNFGGADEDCASAVSRLLPLVCFVHAKDWFRRDGMKYDPGRGFSRTRGGHFRRATIFGHGDVPSYQILAALKQFGYDGYVSIEFEGIEDTILAIEIGSENLKRMIADLSR